MTTLWSTFALEELASVQRGKFSARPRNDPKYYGGDIPFIQTGDVAAGAGRVRSYAQTLNGDGLSVSKLFPKGSLVVTIAANIGDVARVEFDFACPDSLVVVQANKGVDSDWLQYSLESKKKLLESLAPQNAQKNINLEVLRPLAFDVPPLGEQQRIARTLATWDTAIHKAEQLIAAKERRFKVLRERLVASPRNNVSALTAGGRQTMRFGDIFALSKEVAKAGTNFDVLSVTTGGIVRQSEYFNKQVASEDKSGYLIVRRGQLVMSGLNFWMGSIDFQTICDVGIVSPAYKVFSIVGAGLDIDYLRHYVRSSEMRKFLAMSSVQGASIVRRNLDMDQLRDSSISIPNVEKQKAIAAALNAMEQELELLGEQFAALKTQKRGLMQRLLTGQWRLPAQEEAN